MDRSVDRRPWILSLASVGGAACFVAGCVAFYFDSLFRVGVTLFLLGSLLMLAEAVGRAVRR